MDLIPVIPVYPVEDSKHNDHSRIFPGFRPPGTKYSEFIIECLSTPGQDVNRVPRIHFRLPEEGMIGPDLTRNPALLDNTEDM